MGHYELCHRGYPVREQSTKIQWVVASDTEERTTYFLVFRKAGRTEKKFGCEDSHVPCFEGW